jgi:hypothetical protein
MLLKEKDISLTYRDNDNSNACNCTEATWGLKKIVYITTTSRYTVLHTIQQLIYFSESET